MTKNPNLIGPWGEALAAEYLRKKGYTIISANYRSRYGEIDLIVQNKKYVAFVEVKVRANDRFGEAKEFVDSKKQNRLRSTALIWLEQHESQLQPRFDVIEIYAPEGLETRKPRLIHLDNAF